MSCPAAKVAVAEHGLHGFKVALARGRGARWRDIVFRVASRRVEDAPWKAPQDHLNF